MALLKNAFNTSADTGILQDLESTLLGDVAASIGATSASGVVAPYMSGARAIVKINGKIFGFAFGVNFNINTMYDENWTIDNYLPHELMPTRITVNGTMAMFHIPGKSPTNELIQPNVLSFLFHRYITIEITDQTTGSLIFRTNRAVITSKSQVLAAGELSTIQLTWKAIGWKDEKEPGVPNGYDGKPEGDLGLLSSGISAVSGLL